MKKYLLLFVTMLLVTTTTAQSIYYGLKVGLNISNLSRTSNAETRLRGAFGAFTGYQLTQSVALEAEGLISFQGSRIDKENLSLTYLKIPLLAKVGIIENLCVEGGVSFNFLLGSRLAGEPYKGMNGFDFTLPMGVRYCFFNKLELGLRYDLSLVNNGLSSSYTSRNSNVCFSLAFRL